MGDSKYFALGDLMSKHGAVFIAKDIEGAIQAYTDIIKKALQASGIVVTPNIEQEILLYFRTRQEEFDRQMCAQGIPEKLQTLLSYTKKGKLVAYCGRVTISEDELFLLIHNCSQINYTHRSKFLEYVPENRRLTKQDRTSMIEAEPKKFFGKIRAIIDERKNYMVHLFENGEKWHCFYYTYRETEPIGQNHWKYGPHLHYISYLWPEYKQRTVWESFDKRENDIEGVHIRLEPFPTPPQQPDQEFTAVARAFISKYKRS